jgi:hypothetical protein
VLFSLPDIKTINITPKTEAAIKNSWDLLGLSFRNTAAKIVTTTGIKAIIIPASDEEVSFTPVVSKIKYAIGWNRDNSISSLRGLLLRFILMAPDSHRKVSSNAAKEKREERRRAVGRVSRACFVNIKDNPKINATANPAE